MHLIARPVDALAKTFDDVAVTAAAASAMGDLDITTAVVPRDGEGDDGWRERESWKGGALAPLP